MTTPTESEPYPGEIYMDSMHLGMGCTCYQLTFETQSIEHALFLHDILLPWAPILAALSSNAPVHKGLLADFDLRWTVIA